MSDKNKHVKKIVILIWNGKLLIKVPDGNIHLNLIRTFIRFKTRTRRGPSTNGPFDANSVAARKQHLSTWPISTFICWPIHRRNLDYVKIAQQVRCDQVQ